jgi:hypothetical protein
MNQKNYAKKNIILTHMKVMQQSGLFVVTNVIISYGAYASVGITVLTLAEKGTRPL